MGDIHYIVDKLNSPPFKYDLTLLSFSEKSPQELLQLVSDIFSQITPKHQKVDVTKEHPDQTAERLLFFLKIVKYKPTMDPVAFRQLLASGDKEVLYPILKWVVPQPQQLEKRAFVGYYLSFPDMPEELNFDPEIMDLKEEIKRYHQEFVDVHKNSEQVKNLNRDTATLKSRIKQLEEERQKLEEKVQKAKTQVEKIPDMMQYMDVCKALRKQTDEEVYLSQQLEIQKQQLDKAEVSHSKVASRLRELQASAVEGSSTKLLEALQEDVNNLKFQVNERYPKEMEKRQRRLQATQEALANAVNTEMDLQKLHQQVAQLQSQISDIQERRAQQDKSRQGEKAYLQLRQAQQMAGMVSRKKEEINAKMERLQEKKVALMAQYDKLAAAEGAAAGSVSEEEWRQKYESMKNKLPAYKRMKKELGDLEAEVFVLAHTEEILASQVEGIMSSVRAIEKSKGIAGFADVATTLEKVSETKEVLDAEKGMTLAEISRTVEDINAAIKDRKNKLAPQIKKLRSVRQAFQELDAEYGEKKAVYDAAVSSAEGKTSSLDSEVLGVKTEIMDNETKYHLLNCQLAVTDVNIKKVTSGPNNDRLKDKYQQKINEADEQTKVLREQQRNLKDTHSSGLSQIDMMSDLIKLLQLKLDLTKGNGVGLAQRPVTTFDTATANVMVL